MLIAIAIAEEIQGLQGIAFCHNPGLAPISFEDLQAPSWPPGIIAQV
jgi:hypothetical protein